MDKNGYIRTLEAVVAILMIFVFIFTVLPRSQPRAATDPSEIRLLQDAILNQIESNSTYRNFVLNDDKTAIDVYVTDTLKFVGDYGHILNIQDVDNSIVQPNGLPTDKDVYAGSVVVGSNLTKYNPKLVTIYIWDNLS